MLTAELQFVLLGVVYQLLSIVFESARITLVQILIQRKGLRLNPITVQPPSPHACFLVLHSSSMYRLNIVLCWQAGGDRTRASSVLKLLDTCLDLSIACHALMLWEQVSEGRADHVLCSPSQLPVPQRALLRAGGAAPGRGTAYPALVRMTECPTAFEAAQLRIVTHTCVMWYWATTSASTAHISLCQAFAP